METTLAATVPLGESVEFAAAVDGATHANTAWQWPYDNNPPEGSTPTATAASGATVEAVRRDPGKHTLLATDADDDDIAAFATLTATGIKSLTVTDANNPKTNRVTVSTPEDYTLPVDGDPEPTDVPTIYIPYTEDENENSTTKINLAAKSHTGAWPDGKPAWTLTEKPDNANPLPDSPGADFTYTAAVPGIYIFNAECGNTVEARVIVLKLSFRSSATAVIEVPDIPQNAILPSSLSGADEANCVKMVLAVAGPDGNYKFRLSSQNMQKATVSPSTVTVTVQDGVGKSADIKVTGGAISSSKSDVVDITAALIGAESIFCNEDFLRYRFIAAIADYGCKAFTNSFTGGEGAPFDGDPEATKSDVFAGFDAKAGEIEGIEAPTEDEIMVMTTYKVPDSRWEQARWAFVRFEDGGGSAVGAHEEGCGLKQMLAYAKTSGNKRTLSAALTSDSASNTPPYPKLGNGDMTCGISVIEFPEIIEKWFKMSGLYPQSTLMCLHGDSGNSRITEDGGTESLVPDPPNARTVCEVNAPNDDPKYENSSKRLDQKVMATMEGQPGEVQIYTEPSGVFPGEVAVDLKVHQQFSCEGMATAKTSFTDFAMEVGRNISFGAYGVSLSLQWLIPEADRGSAIAVATANLGILRREGDFWYKSSDGTIRQWNTSLIMSCTNGQTPPKFSASANPSPWKPGRETNLIADPPKALQRAIGVPMVFKVNVGDIGSDNAQTEGTSLLVGSGVSSATRKHKPTGFAYIIGQLSAVQVDEVSDYTVIALEPKHYTE